MEILKRWFEIKDLEAFKATIRPRGANWSINLFIMFCFVWWGPLLWYEKVQVADTPNFILASTAILGMYFKYSISRHYNKKTNALKETKQMEIAGSGLTPALDIAP